MKAGGRALDVEAGDVLDADYLGQVWGGKVFDNSYDRGSGAAFPDRRPQRHLRLGPHARRASRPAARVLLYDPPSEGYGSAGQSQAGIKGTDTIVFVVDIVRTFSKDAVGDQGRGVQKATVPSTLTITGKPGSPAKLSSRPRPTRRRPRRR